MDKAKEVRIDVGEQKAKLVSMGKMLSKKASSGEKLTKAQYVQIKQTIKLANGIGLRMVEKKQTAEALDLLKQVENVTHQLLRVVKDSAASTTGEHQGPVLKLLANTCNNIAYLFSQVQNLDSSYTYLLRTLDAESGGEHSNYRKGLTCLNITNLLVKMQKNRDCSKFASRAVEEFQAALNSGDDLDSPEKLGKTKEKLLSAYDLSAMASNLQSRNDETYAHLSKARELAEELYGATDKRVAEYKRKMDELATLLPAEKQEAVAVLEEESAAKITKESIVATTYSTLNGVRMKLIVVDYLKGKSLKVYGMRKDGSFAKSLCLPYTVFQIYFQVEGKAIQIQNIKDEKAIQWMVDRITLSPDNRLLFSYKPRESS